MEIKPKRLIISFVLIFLLGVMFAVVNGYYVSETATSLPIIVYAISFVSIIIGGFIVILFQWKINKVQLNKVIGFLPTDQQKIMKTLLEHKGTLEQNRLVALTGLNKVKISRILSELEFRGAIKRVNLGNTKLVILKE